MMLVTRFRSRDSSLFSGTIPPTPLFSDVCQFSVESTFTCFTSLGSRVGKLFPLIYPMDSSPSPSLCTPQAFDQDVHSLDSRESHASGVAHRYNLHPLAPSLHTSCSLDEDPHPSLHLKPPRGRQTHLSKSIKRANIEVGSGIQTPIDQVLRAKGNPTKVAP